jgi:hypothetical protein
MGEGVTLGDVLAALADDHDQLGLVVDLVAGGPLSEDGALRKTSKFIIHDSTPPSVRSCTPCISSTCAA